MRCQIWSNSPLSIESGTGKAVILASASSSWRFTRTRLSWSYSRCICWPIRPLTSSRASKPSFCASASSSAGSTCSFSALAVMSKVAALPASSAAPYSAGNCTSITLTSPADMPSSCSVKPGMNPSPPTSMSMSLASPPWKGTPSILPRKSTVRTSPFTAGRVSSTTVSSRWRWARPSSALVSASSSGAAVRRVSSMAPKSGMSIVGNSSNETVNSISESGSAFTRSTCGWLAARRPRSSSRSEVALLTLSSSTSAITPPAKRLVITDIGTLPGRKPGRLTVRASSARRLARRSATSAAGTTTLNARFKPSESVSVTNIVGKFLVTARRKSRAQWCGRRDLNPHDMRHQNLNLACLPISPRPHAQPVSAGT